MNATDELRRLLDERGVEWWPLYIDPRAGYGPGTSCKVGGVRHKYIQYGRSISWSSHQDDSTTPEGAIAATLGPDPAALRGLAEGLYNIASEMHAALSGSDQSLIAGYYGACLQSARDKMRELGLGEVDR